jgi:hypothetical protein
MHALFLFGNLPVRMYYIFWGACIFLTTGHGWMIFFPFFFANG